MLKLTSDIVFKTDKKHIFETLRDNKVFNRYIDLLLFAISLGIVNDKTMPVEGEESIEVARNTLSNYKVNEALQFLFKTAILTTTTAKKTFSKDYDRIRLAFDSEYEFENFNKMSFLLSFAPFGIDLIHKHVYATDSLNAADNVGQYLEEILSHDLSSEIMEKMIKEKIQK